MIAVAAAVVAAVAAGAWARRRFGERAEDAGRHLLSALIYTVVPFVAFVNVTRLEASLDLGAGIVLALAAVSLTGLAAWLLARRALGLGAPQAGAVVIAAILANTGYLGLPLTVALLGSDELGEAVAYDAAVGAPVLLLGAFGVAAATGERAGHGAGQRLRAFFLRNPPLLAVFAALAAPDSLAPDVLVDASRVLVAAILPLGFFAAGAILSGAAGDGDGRSRRALAAPVGLALALRLIVAPALLLGMSAPLIDLPGAFLVEAAMPCGINALAVAHLYGLDERISAAAITLGTVAVLAGALVADAAFL